MANKMKKLASLSNKEILEFVLSSKVLSSKFDRYIYDCEMEYINEKLECFKQSVEYSLDTYIINSFKIEKPYNWLVSTADTGTALIFYKAFKS